MNDQCIGYGGDGGYIENIYSTSTYDEPSYYTSGGDGAVIIGMLS